MTFRRHGDVDEAAGLSLRWHHTEFGRRTDCGSFRIVHHPDGGWQLLDAAWNLIERCESIAAAQRLAEAIVIRATAPTKATA